MTLADCGWGGLSVSDQIVEPAIAATIIGMAAFDIWTRRRGMKLPSFVRLFIVLATHAMPCCLEKGNFHRVTEVSFYTGAQFLGELIHHIDDTGNCLTISWYRRR